MPKGQTVLNFIDLFAGAGGLSEGFIQAGFNPIAHVEMNAMAARTLETKGIEFDKVFVIPNKMSKNEKYIAYTRALSELVIVVDENLVDQIVDEED